MARNKPESASSERERRKRSLRESRATDQEENALEASVSIPKKRIVRRLRRKSVKKNLGRLAARKKKERNEFSSSGQEGKGRTH